MAKKYAKEKPESEETKARGDNKKLLTRIRERAPVMIEADETNRRDGLEDMRFIHIPGEQWDAKLKKERGDRPCYEFNKVRVTNKRVINHVRANRPQWKVLATEDGDKDTADVYSGLMRNVWNVSDADSVVDYQAEYSVGAGYGVFRIATEYSDDTVFDQDIFIRGFKNPMNVYPDPASSDMMKRDANDWLVLDKISNEEFDRKYPKAKRVSFDDLAFDDDDEWEEENTTRICEYWYKEPYTKTIYLLANGKTVEELPAGEVPLKTREVKCHQICSVIASGNAILEGPKKWAGKYFPFVPIYGEWIVIDGKTYWYGLTRHSKDAQRAYNSDRTAVEETIAQTPQTKYWMTPAQFKGLGDHIAEAHKKNYPVAFYNNDPSNPGPPQRMGGAEVPVALVQAATLNSEDIKATSGIFDPSLGQQSNETSGRAIVARQNQGEIATYNFPDNIAKAVRRAGEIIVDLIPHIYDTARSIRILGSDGAEKFVKINEPVMNPETGQIEVQNDLTRGKYDLTVTTGPSFSTQRQEATAMYSEIATRVPQLWAVAGDLMMKGMDLPYADEMAERIRTMLPPAIQEQISKDKPIPPEVQAVMAQAQQAMQLVQQQSQLVQAAAQEVEQSKLESEKAKANAEKVITQIKVEEEKFKALVAQELAKLAVEEAQLIQKGAQITVQGAQVEAASQDFERAQGEVNLKHEAEQALKNIADYGGQFAEIAQHFVSQLEPPKPPKTVKRIKQMVRGPDGLRALIEETDEGGNILNTRNARISRDGADIVGEIDDLDDTGQVVGVRQTRVRREPNGDLTSVN